MAIVDMVSLANVVRNRCARKCPERRYIAIVRLPQLTIVAISLGDLWMFT